MLCKITDPNCTSEYNGDVELPELGKWYSWEEVMTLAAFNVSIYGYGFVYVYYDMVNRKYYVGVCKQAVRTRSRQHYKKTGKLSRIDSIIKDIGCNRILVCIIKVCRVEDLEYFENYFIDSLDTKHPNGYNVMKSGYKNIDSNIQEMLSRELPKERLLDLLNNGYTYRTIANTMLPFKVSESALSTYGKSHGIFRKRRGSPSPSEVAELSKKGYSTKEIAQELGYKSIRAITKIKSRYNIPSIRPIGNARSVLKIDLNSGVILDRYISVSSAGRLNGIHESTVRYKIYKKTGLNGAYFIYEDEYLDQQRSSTQVVEGA